MSWAALADIIIASSVFFFFVRNLTSSWFYVRLCLYFNHRNMHYLIKFDLIIFFIILITCIIIMQWHLTPIIIELNSDKYAQTCIQYFRHCTHSLSCYKYFIHTHLSDSIPWSIIFIYIYIYSRVSCIQNYKKRHKCYYLISILTGRTWLNVNCSNRTLMRLIR